MVRIRLRRVGQRHQPSYRIVAADKEAPRDGRFLEILGFYNPLTDPFTLEVKEDRVFDWFNKGAQPSESVLKLFTIVGLMGRYTRLKDGELAETLQAEAAQVYEKRSLDARNPQTSK
ncbi:MAG TPA: 30S ribosomal protein S16 [Levilinea sp.]|nr:30S ribosomal protein S16 [Levilinea sp.]